MQCSKGQWLLLEHAVGQQQHWAHGASGCVPVPRLLRLVHGKKGALRMIWAAWQPHQGIQELLCFWGSTG